MWRRPGGKPARVLPDTGSQRCAKTGPRPPNRVAKRVRPDSRRPEADQPRPNFMPAWSLAPPRNGGPSSAPRLRRFRHSLRQPPDQLHRVAKRATAPHELPHEQRDRDPSSSSRRRRAHRPHDQRRDHPSRSHLHRPRWQGHLDHRTCDEAAGRADGPAGQRQAAAGGRALRRLQRHELHDGFHRCCRHRQRRRGIRV